MRRAIQSEPTHYEVGKFYKVPCVWASWPYTEPRYRWWPVLGPQHEDKETLEFPYQHYHVDFRFLDKAAREDLATPLGPPQAFSAVITSMNIATGNVHPGGVTADMPTDYPSTKRIPEDPSWFRVRRLKCKAQWPDYPRSTVWWIHDLEHSYQGQKLRQGRYCLHKGTDLGTIIPDGDVVTCPLHGLRWNVRTGEMVPWQSKAGTSATATASQI